MLLTEKLQELEQTKNYFDTSLNEAKALLKTNVESAVKDEIDSKLENLKSSLKSHFDEQITQNIQEQFIAQLEKTNINELFEKWLKNSERVFYALQMSVTSFLKANDNEFKKRACENIDNLDFKSFLKHSQDEINEVLNEFKTFITNEMLETTTLKENLLKQFIKNHKDEIFERVDLSFLKKEFLANESILNAIKEQITQAVEKKFKDESFSRSLSEIMLFKLENEMKKKFSSYEMLKLRFQNATSALAMCVHNEISSITSALKSIKELEFYELKLQNKDEVINKTYEIR